MALEKEYQNIYAYKPDEGLECFFILFLYLFLCVSCCFGLILSIFFIIGIIVTSMIWGWALITLIRHKLMPKFVFTQKDEDLIIFPDARNIIVPLKEIVAIKKKNARGKNGELPYGKITIITKNGVYKLRVKDLNLIFSRLEGNLKVANS